MRGAGVSARRYSGVQKRGVVQLLDSYNTEKGVATLRHLFSWVKKYFSSYDITISAKFTNFTIWVALARSAREKNVLIICS